MKTPKRIAACVLTDEGHLLAHTCQSTVERCEEAAKDRWGTTWGRMKELGARVVQVEIRALDTALNPLPGGKFDTIASVTNES